LVLRLVSLGHAARNKAEIKVRQPLAEVAFAVGKAQEARVVNDYQETLAEELNVKQVRALGEAGEAITYSLNPLPRQLGSKYKDKFPQVRKALLALDPVQAAGKLLDNQPVTVEVGGETLEILPDEVEVRADAKTGLTVAQEGAYLAALSTELTPELVDEGLAREFIRRVQDLRKTLDFDIADRIKVYYQASDKLAGAVAAHQEYIMGEVLAVELKAEAAPENALTPEEPFTFDGEEVSLGLVKVG
jgi:isoleucyl-tRNA synthetase